MPSANFNRRIIDDGPDFYPTPAWGTEALLHYEKFSGEILEPCCGDGAICKVLEERYKDGPIIGSDLHYRGYGHQRDFFDYEYPFDNIVTNPPFSLAEDMLDHALGIARRKVAFFLRTAFLESTRRYNSFFRKRPPARVLVFTRRISLYPAGQAGVKGGGTTSYSSFVWNAEEPVRATTITWIDPLIGAKKRKQRDLFEGAIDA